MWNFIKRLFLGRQLSDVISETKIVKVHGIRFTIKKLDPTCFLEGSKVMLQTFDTYKLKKDTDAAEVTEAMLKKVKAHYIDVFCSGVVKPALVRSTEESTPANIFVEYLFTDWDLAHGLYQAVVEFTYGKKKFKLGI